MTSPGSGRNSIGVRVRPNSHDFIRDLRAQLATKKQTFYVNVQARTGGASNDVRTWARGPLQKIHAAVPITASFLRANAEVANWRFKMAQNKTFIPIHADTSPAEREILALRAMAAQGITVPVRADTTRARNDAERAVRSRPARSASGGDGTIKFDPGAEERAARKFQSTLDKILSDQKVDVDTKPAERNFRALLDKFGDELAQNKPELDLDTSKAEAKEARFRREAQKDIKRDLDIQLKETNIRLAEARIAKLGRDVEVNLRVKTGGLERAEKGLARFEKRMGSLSLVRSLDLGPFNVGKPSGFLGTLTTITTLAAALPAIVTGVSALSNAFMGLASAASLLPGAIGGALASLSTFSIATKGMGDALSAMFALWDEGASEQASASRRTLQAQGNLSKAVYDEAKAQKNVAKARREALHDLRDLNNELRGSVLNEAQAILDLQAARDAYAKGQAEGFENETERLQLDLNIRKAQEGLITTREDAIKTQERANTAQAEGVEGSEKVQDALHAQTQAMQQAAEAMEAMQSSQATGALGKFRDQLAQLSPNAQSFLLALTDLKSPLTEFRNELQDTFSSGFAERVGSVFNNLLPAIKPGMTGIAAAMNQTILQVFDTLESPEGKSIIERIMGGTAEAQKALTGVIDPLIKGVGTLVAAGAEHLPQVVDLIGSLADRFLNFIEAADADGTLDKFFDEGVTAMKDMADIGINLLKIINDFSTAWKNSFGESVLTSLSRITDKWHEFLSSEEGQKRLNGYIAEAKELWEEWKPVLEQLPGVFDAVADGARAVLDIVLPVLKEFAEFAKDHPALVAGIIGAWLGAKVIIAPLVTIFKALGGIVKVIKMIPGVSTALASVGTALGTLGVPGMPRVGPGGAPRPPATNAGLPSVIAGAGVTAGLTGLALMMSVASDANANDQAKLDAYYEAHATAATPQEKAEVTRAYLAGTEITKPKGRGGGVAGTAGINSAIKKDSNLDKSIREDIASGSLPEFKIGDDGRIRRSADNIPLPTYGTGGFTPWGQKQGRLVQLHGKEYVQPADTTAYYGVNAMRAIHEKRVPPGLLRSFQGGGLNEEEERLRAQEQNPAGGGIISALNTGIGSAVAVGSNLISQGMSHLQGAAAPAGTPGGPVIGSVPGLGTPPGPLAPAAPGLAPTPVATNNAAQSQASINLFGFEIPLGGTPAGWPGDGKPPVGLGGGPAGPNGEPPLDIRKYGIGPGPAGSTPSDWINYTAKLGGEFISGVGTSLLTGVLDFFGLGGVLNSPYTQAATGLAGHFLNPSGGADSSPQGAGAGETNTQTQALLDYYDSMGLNPDYPGVPTLPGVIDPATGSALPAGQLQGLQVATANGEQQIRAHFPWATNIGGVRPDEKKWHPSGLALDVMTDPGLGNNSSTPQGLAKGDALVAWLKANQKVLGIDYILWREDDHWNHVHVNFSPSGGGGGTPTSVHAAQDQADAAAVDAALADTGVGNGGPTTQELRDAGLIPPMPSSKPAASSPLPPPGNAAKSENWLDLMLGRYNGGYISSFDGGGMVPMAHNEDWGGFGQWGGGGIGASLGGFGQVRPPSAGPPTGFWQGPPQVSPDRMWPGPLPGSNVPGSPGAGIHGRKIWDIAGTGPRPVSPRWASPRGSSGIRSFAAGGYNAPTGVVRKPMPFPRGPQAKTITPPSPKPPAMAPKPMVPSTTPAAPSISPAPTPHIGTGAPPGPARESGAIQVGPRPSTPQAPDDGMHLHPAIRKGIASGAATIGALADTAIAVASMGATAGLGGAAGGAAGALGGGAGGLSASGLIMQGGKIIEDIANVGASFLVGNITGGTTENPYGVTQRGNMPSGGTRVVNASQNHYGDIQTSNLDEYFKLTDRRNAQRAQSSLGRWGNA